MAKEAETKNPKKEEKKTGEKQTEPARQGLSEQGEERGVQGQATQRTPTASQQPTRASPGAQPGKPGEAQRSGTTTSSRPGAGGPVGRPTGGGKEPAGARQDLRNLLRGAAFPANRSEIIEAARRNDAPNDLVQELRNLPDHRYSGVEEVMNEYKRQH